MLLFEVQERPGRDQGVKAFSAGLKNVKRRTYGTLKPRQTVHWCLPIDGCYSVPRSRW